VADGANRAGVDLLAVDGETTGLEHWEQKGARLLLCYGNTGGLKKTLEISRFGASHGLRGAANRG